MRLIAPGDGQQPERDPLPVPPLLRDAAAWAWRLLLVGVLIYLVVRFLAKLYLLVLPFFAAMVLTALLRPVVGLLRRWMPRLLATWLTIILGFAVLGGIGFFVVNRTISDYPTLVTQVSQLTSKLSHFLTAGPLHLQHSRVTNIQDQIVSELQKNQKTVVSGVVTGLALVGKLAAAGALCFFITFFLVYDGERIWRWVVALFPPAARRGVDEAGTAAWGRLSGYVKGTFCIAVIHALIVAAALTILGVPLVAPLALLVFLGSFIPIVGSVIFGGFAVAVTLLTKGLVGGLVLVGVLIADNQLEAHVLQPFLVGRFLRLHPLAVVLAIAAGGFLAGIIGAIIALPITAMIYAIIEYYVNNEARTPTIYAAESPDRLGGGRP